jgi:hypothetical protein
MGLTTLKTRVASSIWVQRQASGELLLMLPVGFESDAVHLRLRSGLDLLRRLAEDRGLVVRAIMYPGEYP